jgi:hypothetical protein
MPHMNKHVVPASAPVVGDYQLAIRSKCHITRAAQFDGSAGLNSDFCYLHGSGLQVGKLQVKNASWCNAARDA